MPTKRIFNFVLALALLILGVVDVIYLAFYAKEITLVLIGSAALTLGVGAFWLYSELTATAPDQGGK